MIATHTPNGGAVELDQRELDRRDVLALTQYLTVLDDLPEVAGDENHYIVVSESGREYVVDAGEGSCSCPDYRYRDVRCKHVRRVEFATGERPIPAGIDFDPDLGRHVGGPGWGDPDDEFPVGAVVRDRRHDRSGRMRVVGVLEERADEYAIDPGRTVADYNPAIDPADRVVEVVFEGDLDRHVPGWRTWAAADLPARLEAYCEEWDVDVRIYAFPHSRIERVYPNSRDG